MVGAVIRSMATIHCNVMVEEQNPEMMVCQNRGSSCLLESFEPILTNLALRRSDDAGASEAKAERV